MKRLIEKFKNINFGPQNAPVTPLRTRIFFNGLSFLCFLDLNFMQNSEKSDEQILKNVDFGPKNDLFSPFWA